MRMMMRRRRRRMRKGGMIMSTHACINQIIYHHFPPFPTTDTHRHVRPVQDASDPCFLGVVGTRCGIKVGTKITLDPRIMDEDTAIKIGATPSGQPGLHHQSHEV